MEVIDVVLIAGDGIGPEVTAAACEVIKAAGAPIHWLPMPAGVAAIESHGDVLPAVTLDALRQVKVHM